MNNILTLNSISNVIDDIFTKDYKVASEIENPIGIMLRSFSMHEYDLPTSVLAVARAGAGTNNIPVDDYAKKGVVVFNTPGANANAVKELVILGLLLGSRKVAPAMDWAKTLSGKGEEVGKLVEKGKSQFVGGEILGKTLGLIGLGAIGAMVANAAMALGMKVIGYDPFLSPANAEKLAGVKVLETLDEVYANADYLSLHLPFTKDNKGMINKEVIAKMKDGAVIVNCARGELVDNDAIIEATATGKIGRYVTDFPNDAVLCKENIVCIPHLGASTPEAEDNCAVMAANQLIDYIENGNILNSVNYPNCSAPRTNKVRYVVLAENSDALLADVAKIAGSANLTNKVKKAYACILIDTDADGLEDSLKAVNGVTTVRVIK